MSPTAQRIVAVLSRARLPLEDEKQLQAAVAAELERAGIYARREWRVHGGLIDFAVTLPQVASGELLTLLPFVGIEVKIAGSKRDVYRQLVGYCGDGRLRELIVATSKPLSLPREISRTPITVVNLGRAWL
jgi:hypothetical protein